MQTHTFVRAILLSIASLLITMPVQATLPTEGTWPATTITTDETVNLTGDVTISGIIRLSAKLIINNASGKSVVLKTKIGQQCMIINTSGSLEINGNSDSERIIFDGGTDYTWDDATYTLNSPHTITGGRSSFIDNNSEISANYATFRNINSTSAIAIFSEKKSSFKNCVFERIYGNFLNALAGSVMHIGESATIPLPEESAITLEDCVIRNCVAVGGDHEDMYSGLIRAIGSSSHDIVAKNLTMERNYMAGGGCICFLSAKPSDVKIVLDGCTFNYNKVGTNGGALWIEGNLELQGDPTMISHNYAGRNGGGLYIPTYGGFLITERTDRKYNLNSKLIITDNECAGYGGGISFDFKNENLPNNSTVTANIDGVIIRNNKAGLGGGGIYFRNVTSATKNYTFTINLNSGTISDNESPLGAGLYVESIDVENAAGSTSICDLTGNLAKNGGGIYIKNGKLSLNEISITNNTSTNNGGGIYIEGGTFAITSGTISENTASRYGGGVYSSHSGAEYIYSHLLGGTIKHNSALAGGGICVDGKVRFSTTRANIEDNIASNGGGICVINGAQMTYKSGLVRRNKATATSVISNTTAYLKGVNDIEGFGGGVFVSDNSSSLSFDMATGSIGLYDNIATNGADDIFSNGNGTSVTIPNVESMEVAGVDIPAYTKPLWLEDYSTNDTNYDKGTNINTEWSGTNLRYRDAKSSGISAFNVPAQSYIDKYISLALGYGNIYITVRKTGLKKGESAIFNIIKEGEVQPYLTLVLTGVDDAGSAVARSIALYTGTWTVEETTWSWAYNCDSTSLTHTITSQSDPLTLFEFTNTPTTPTPPHNEGIKVNILQNE